MRKIILALTLSLSLAGCATIQAVTNGVSIATKSITNPVTKTQEAQIELAVDAALNALQAYKSACAKGTADKNCRSNVAQIQVYTRQVGPIVVQLRTFVDSNDQINAIIVYNQLTTLYNNIKSAALATGVKLGA